MVYAVRNNERFGLIIGIGTGGDSTCGIGTGASNGSCGL
jgi:hypothetical protein